MERNETKPAIVYGTRAGMWVTYRAVIMGDMIEYRGIYNPREDPTTDIWLDIQLETLRKRLHALIASDCHIQKARFAARARGATPHYLKAMYGF